MNFDESLEERIEKYANKIYQNQQDAAQCLPNYTKSNVLINELRFTSERLDPEKLLEIVLMLQESFEVGQKYCFFDKVEFTSEDIEKELENLENPRQDREEWLNQIESTYMRINKLYTYNQISVPDLNPEHHSDMR